jgi:hypothetical protein
LANNFNAVIRHTNPKKWLLEQIEPETEEEQNKKHLMKVSYTQNHLLLLNGICTLCTREMAISKSVSSKLVELACNTIGWYPIA